MGQEHRLQPPGQNRYQLLRDLEDMMIRCSTHTHPLVPLAAITTPSCGDIFAVTGATLERFSEVSAPRGTNACRSTPAKKPHALAQKRTLNSSFQITQNIM